MWRLPFSLLGGLKRYMKRSQKFLRDGLQTVADFRSKSLAPIPPTWRPGLEQVSRTAMRPACGGTEVLKAAVYFWCYSATQRPLWPRDACDGSRCPATSRKQKRLHGLHPLLKGIWIQSTPLVFVLAVAVAANLQAIQHGLRLAGRAGLKITGKLMRAFQRARDATLHLLH